MTRRDYVRIAAALAATRPTYEGDTFGRAIADQWRADVLALADMLGTDNPRFDRDRFCRAAGMLPEAVQS